MFSAPSLYLKVSDDSFCSINIDTAINVKLDNTYLKLENMYSTILGCTKKNRMINVAIILDVFFSLDTLFFLQKYMFQNSRLPRARIKGNKANMIIF